MQRGEVVLLPLGLLDLVAPILALLGSATLEPDE